MKYKVGDRVRVRNKLPNNPIEIGHIGTIKAIDPLNFDYIYKLDNNICYLKEEWLVKLPSRSAIGKKAYKTFLKNGGSRNSKGQFSKKQFESKWFSYLDRAVSDVMLNGTTVKIRKQNIDWDWMEEELVNKYVDQKYNKKNFAKAAAKVFQKHGLIDKGVEI